MEEEWEMGDSFQNILAQHMEQYPLMEVQDCVKLAYQHEFGPGHAAAELSVLCADIQAERSVLPSGVCCPSERIGNGLKRFSLFELESPEQNGRLLARMLLRTAEIYNGSMERFQCCLAQIESALGSGPAEWLAGYWKQGCPPVRHSAAYRAAYHPHYRLVREAYFDYFPVLATIDRQLQRGRPIVAAIDGRCGSGKTTLAVLIRELFPCNIFHMDDFYLPPDLRPEHWMEIPAGNMDLTRFRDEVLLPARAGQTVQYQPFRCQTGRLEVPVSVPPRPLTVVEGSYSNHPRLAEHYDWSVFLTCAPGVQRGRLEKREGEGIQAFLERWIPCEERYFRAFQTERKSAMVLDTSTFLAVPGPVRPKSD